jgi:hypothetical protein
VALATLLALALVLALLVSLVTRRDARVRAEQVRAYAEWCGSFAGQIGAVAYRVDGGRGCMVRMADGGEVPSGFARWHEAAHGRLR